MAFDPREEQQQRGGLVPPPQIGPPQAPPGGDIGGMAGALQGALGGAPPVPQAPPGGALGGMLGAGPNLAAGPAPGGGGEGLMQAIMAMMASKGIQEGQGPVGAGATAGGGFEPAAGLGQGGSPAEASPVSAAIASGDIDPENPPVQPPNEFGNPSRPDSVAMEMASGQKPPNQRAKMDEEARGAGF